MNKLCSYLLMLVAIDMYGMELLQFEKSFNNIPLKKEEKESFNNFKPNYSKILDFNIDNINFRYLKNDDKSNCCLFFAWILHEYIKKNNSKIAEQNLKIEAGGGYFFFDKNTMKNNFFINNNYTTFKIESPNFIFKGLEAKFYITKSTQSNISLLKNQLEMNKIKNEIYKKNILPCAQSVYKIHLMPNNDTVLLTLYRLFELFNANPIINTQGARLNDYINNVKIKLNPLNDGEYDTMPVIVLYVANFFLPKSTESVDTIITNLDKDNFFSNFDQYVNYKKSKQCTQDLLAYLVYFFNQHPECEGSGIVPRFNAKVTDMIFFAQGNGDDKKHEEYFENDKVYFQSNKDQDFKINIPHVLEQAKNMPSQTLNNLPTNPSLKQNNLKKEFRYNNSQGDNSQSTVVQKPLFQQEEPSLGILTLIGNWFKSWAYTLFQILNF